MITTHINGDSIRAVISFRDPTQEELAQVAASAEVFLTDSERQSLQQSIVDRTRSIANSETRKEAYVRVLTTIMAALQTPEEANIAELLQTPQIKALLPNDFDATNSNLSTNVTALESIIAGLSGDQRYRDIRSIVDALAKDSTKVLSDPELQKARDVLKKNIINKDNQYFRVSEVDKMSPQDITKLFRDMTMATIQSTFANDRETQKDRVDAYSATELTTR